MHGFKKKCRNALACVMTLAAVGLLASLFSGCFIGGGKQFTIASGNWYIPLPGTAWAGGSLIQSGSSIKGVLHVTGSPCFDPVADELIVTGAASNDGSNKVTFASEPIRGQVLTVKGSYAATLSIHFGPPRGPQQLLDATETISGGACAGQASSSANYFTMTGHPVGDIGTLFGSSNPWTGTVSSTSALIQSVPDASGYSHVTGGFTFFSSPCFTSGTVPSSTVLGNTVQMTIDTDSGLLVGSGTFIVLDPLLPYKVQFNFTVQGGTCNGETVVSLIEVIQ